MTNPFDTASLTQGSVDLQPKSAPEEFSMRTMKEDLADAAAKPPLSPAPAIQSEKMIPANTSALESPAKPLEQKELAPQETREVQRKPLAPIDVTELVSTKNPSVKGNAAAIKIISLVAILLIIALLGLGGYYFWMTNSEQQQPTIPQAPVETPVAAIEDPAVTAPPAEAYSAENPNYLTIDLSVLAPEAIQKTIIDTAARLPASATAAYEFVVVDSNNNPVAFPIFATAAKLTLSPALLSSLGESFSLFLYGDGGNMHLAFAADISKKEALGDQLLKQEKTFADDASFLFLGAAPEIKTGAFGTGSYDGYSIRYLNLNKALTLSIDYSLTDTKFVVGTSKNTTRAVLSKLKPPITYSGAEQGVSITMTPASSTDVSMADVIDKFKTCDSATYSDGVLQYTLAGKQGALCSVMIKGLENTQMPTYTGKEMVCLWDNASKTYEQAMAGVFGDSCTGTLKDAFIQSM